MKKTSTLNDIMSAFKECVPAVYAAMIGERDAFMADAIAESLASGDVLVSVTGAAHVPGIERNLATKYGFALKQRVCGSI